MSGAAYLCQTDWAKNAIVVDIGGTTTDVGQLVNGYPREAGTKVEVNSKLYIRCA
jgi:N-methylhydantoinase A/oxoprolinase/acetone carboxylase beta subunit